MYKKLYIIYKKNSLINTKQLNSIYTTKIIHFIYTTKFILKYITNNNLYCLIYI